VITVPEHDITSFDAFVVSVWPRLYRTAFALTGNRHDADDLLQAAFARTYRSWHRVRDADRPEAYVHRVIVNEAVSARRRPWRRERSWAVPPEHPAAEPAEVGHLDGVWGALLALPPRQRAILVLRYYEDLSEADIAETLGIARGSVKSQASAGLRALRRHLPTPDPEHTS
jgi:RNA polymerase sigma-70 factor (sigma-E family)